MKSRSKIFFTLTFLYTVFFFTAVITIITKLSSESLRHDVIDLYEFLGSDLFRDNRIITLNCEVTAYCPGPCCNSGTCIMKGKRVFVDWSDKVAVGNLSIKKLHRSGIDIVAVDPSIIPYGSIVYYQKSYYIALDSGSAIKGKRIDISVLSHDDTISFGRRHNQRIIVFIPENPRTVVSAVKRIINKRESI